MRLADSQPLPGSPKERETLKKRNCLPITRAVTRRSFRFRLAPVRAVREREENLAKQELANALSRLSGSEQSLRAAEEHLEQAHEQQRAVISQAQTVNATELLARQEFLEHAEAQRGLSVRDLRQREDEVAARDVELTHAAAKHEMLKRLESRHRSEHDRELVRQEQGALDEIAAEHHRRSIA